MASGGLDINSPSDFRHKYHMDDSDNVLVDKNGQPIPVTVELEKHLVVKAIKPQDLFGTTQTRTGGYKTPASKLFDPSALNSTMINPASPALATPLNTEPLSPVISGRSDISNDTVTFNPDVALNIKEDAKRVIINTIDDPKTSLSAVGDILALVKNGKPNDQDQESVLRQEYEQRQKALIQNYEDQLAALISDHEAALGSEKLKYEQQIQAYQLACNNRIQHLNELKDQEIKKFRVQQQHEIETLQAQKQKEIGNIQAQINLQQQTIDNLQAQLQSQKQFYDSQINSLKRSQTAPNPVGTHTQAHTYMPNTAPLHSTVTSMPPPNFSIPPPDISRIPQQAFSFNMLNQTILDSFTSSQDKLAEAINKQASLAHLHSVTSYDGNDPQKFQNWVDEVTRLECVTPRDFLDIALCTSRGQLNEYLRNLKGQHLDWEVIKSKLRERFSDCTSEAAAKSKLSQLKQNNSSLHEYIAKFTELLEYGHKLKPSDPSTNLFAITFINGLNDSYRYTRSKLREKTGDSIEFFFNEAISLQHKQDIRSIDYGEPKQISLSECEIQAIRSCYKCGSEDHFIRDCPKPSSNSNACFKCGSQEHFARNCTNQNQNQNQKPSQFKQNLGKPEETNKIDVDLLLQRIADLVSQKPNNETTYRPKSTYSKSNHRHNHKHSNQGKHSKGSFNRYKAQVQTNAIEETDESSCSESCEEGEGNTQMSDSENSKN